MGDEGACVTKQLEKSGALLNNVPSNTKEDV